MYNAIDSLPKNIKQKLNEIHPPTKSEISFFLQNTKQFHGLFDGMNRYNNYLNSNKISRKDFNYLRYNLNKKTYNLKRPVCVNGTKYCKMTLSKPVQPSLFFNPLGVYLVKEND